MVPSFPQEIDSFNYYVKCKLFLGGIGSHSSYKGHIPMESSDNSNQSGRVNLVQKEYFTIAFFFGEN